MDFITKFRIGSVALFGGAYLVVKAYAMACIPAAESHPRMHTTRPVVSEQYRPQPFAHSFVEVRPVKTDTSIGVTDLQRLVDGYADLRHFPKDGTITLGFAKTVHDPPTQYFTFIGEERKVVHEKVEHPDLTVILEEGWIPHLKQGGNLCRLAWKVRREGGYMLDPHIDGAEAVRKYGDLARMQKCLPL